MPSDRIAVLSSRGAFARAVADALADALAAVPAQTAPAAQTTAERSARIALPDDVAVDPAHADAIVAVDPGALARAIELDVPHRIAWIGWLDRDWAEVLAGADAVLVAHPALVAGAISLGAPRARVKVAALVAPRASQGGTAEGDAARVAARTELGLPPEAPILIVPFEALGDDLTALLVQLSLVKDDVCVLFDVGRDAEAARALRRRATFPAQMFAEGPIAERAWAAADRALARLEGPELARALASAVAPVLAPPRATDVAIARALADAGLATIASSDVTLAVAIDEACTRGSIDRARAALAALDAASGASRVAACVREVLAELHRASPDGLPTGLEAIGPDREPTPVPGAKDPGPGGPGPEDEIEKELAALRERIRGT